MKITGLDLSLTSTGIGHVYLAAQPGASVCRLKASARMGTGHERLQWLLDSIDEHTRTSEVCLVEGPSFGSPNKQHALGGLWWSVAHKLWQRGVPYVVVTPDQLKIYAAGKRVEKDQVLAAVIRRYPAVEVTGNDEADGLALAALGADYFGFPLATVPATHRRAVGLVKWPARFEEIREVLSDDREAQVASG